jgi:hypothetical protein
MLFQVELFANVPGNSYNEAVVVTVEFDVAFATLYSQRLSSALLTTVLVLPILNSINVILSLKLLDLRTSKVFVLYAVVLLLSQM